MKRQETMKKGLGSVDIKKALERKLELRDVQNYSCDKKRKALGWDDLKYKQHLEKVPANLRVTAHLAFQGDASPSRAIRAMCEHCVGYSNVKEEISGCRGSSCPLYAYRPYQSESAEE